MTKIFCCHRNVIDVAPSDELENKQTWLILTSGFHLTVAMVTKV